MKNIKVEINGVNTATLPVLSQTEQMKMLRDIKNGKVELKDEFIKCNLRLVLSITKKFNFRGENVDDIFQVGVVGLIKAINNFDINQNVQFSTYAVPMIIGEIRRYLRDNSKIRISRSLKDIAYKSLQFKEQYQKIHSKEPSIEEIAKALEIEPIDIVVALEAVQEPISIYTPIFNNGGDEIYLIDQISDNSSSEEKRLNQIIIEEGMERLNERLKNIIHERYYEGKTQMEIAEEIGISQAQVSRLEKSALKIIFGKE